MSTEKETNAAGPSKSPAGESRPGKPIGRSVTDTGATLGSLPRRRFLEKGLLGGAALVILGASGLALRRGHGRAEPSGALLVLDAAGYATLAALAARLVPGDGATDWPTAADVDCAGAIDRVLGGLDPADAKDFARFVGLLDNGLFTLLTAGSLTCFSDLSPAEQDARLEAWAHSHLAVVRSGLTALKRLVQATYYASPLTYARVGYPGPPQIGAAAP